MPDISKKEIREREKAQKQEQTAAARKEKQQAIAAAARKKLAAATSEKQQKKLLKTAQKAEVRMHKEQKKESLYHGISAGTIGAKEAKREFGTIRRHNLFDFVKRITSAFRNHNPIGDEGRTAKINGSELTNKGRTFLGGTKPMYEYTDSFGKSYLCKEAVNAVGLGKPSGALVSESAYRLQKFLDPSAAIETFVERSADQKKVLGSYQAKIDVDKTAIDLFKWQATPVKDAPKLSKDITNQILREHVTDWLLCNFDTKGENFLTNTQGQLLGIDKEQAFRFLDSPSARHMSKNYSPNPNETLYDTVFKRFASGDLDLDLNETQKYVDKIKSLSKDEYLDMFRDTIASKASGNPKKQKKLEDQIWDRAANLEQEYKNFYSSLVKERYPDNANDYLDPETGAFEFQKEAPEEEPEPDFSDFLEFSSEMESSDSKWADLEWNDLSSEDVTLNDLDLDEPVPSEPKEYPLDKDPRAKLLNSLLEEPLALITDIGIFPIDSSLSDNFADVDPYRKHSALDLSIEQRMLSVRARFPLCDEAVQKIAENLEHNESLETLKSGFEKKAIEYGAVDYAISHGTAELKGEEKDTAVRQLNLLKDGIEKSTESRTMDAYVTQMEYLTGLRKEIPTKEQLDLLKNSELDVSFRGLTPGISPSNRQKEIPVHFENSQNWEWQSAITDAALTGKGKLKEALHNFKTDNPEKEALSYSTKNLTSYCDKTMKRNIDNILEDTENPNFKKINKNDVIFIDGTNVGDLLKKSGVDLNSSHLDQIRNLFLASALQSGKKIDIFKPDPQTGKVDLSKDPVSLTREGFEPNEANKPHLSKWQYFWSTFGFYEKKAEKLDRFEQVHKEKESLSKTAPVKSR